MQPVYSKPEEKKPEQATKMLGTGMASQAAGFLRGRKKQIDDASNYANGGMVKDYMDGGMVRGPGTGTSDDIPAMVRPGSYVMPADSTKAMGFKPEARRVNLSNGEMVIPPGLVQRIGMQKLDEFRAKTHKNGAKKSDGMNFNGGGGIPGASEEERMAAQRALAERGRITGTDFTRNVSNTLNALAPVAGIGSAGAGLVSAANKLGNAGAAATPALGKVAAYGTPIAGFGAISSASQPPAPPSVASPSLMDRARTTAPTTPAVTPPVGAPPSTTPAPAPATPGATEVRPGIFRQGNSFSDTAAGAAEFDRPNVISPQNMAAADALAQRSAARNPLVAAAQQQMGGGNITPRTSGSGFGLLDQGYRDRRAAMMDAQQMKPGSREALAALLRQQGEAPGLELRREGMELDQENRAADLGFRREELGARMGDAAATRDLRERELGDNMQTNAVRRDAAGLELEGARRLQALQQEYLNAKTPEAREEAARKLQALSGRQEQANRFTVVPQGSMVDPTSGQVVQQPAMVINNQTGQPVQIGGQQRQAQQPLPNHIAALKANPSQAALFDQRYGAGAAARVLGQQ